MAWKEDPDKKVNEGLEEFSEIASQSTLDYPSVLSGISKTMQGYDAQSGLMEEAAKNREAMRSSTASSFDPIITHSYRSPRYEELAKDLKEKKKARKDFERQHGIGGRWEKNDKGIYEYVPNYKEGKNINVENAKEEYATTKGIEKEYQDTKKELEGEKKKAESIKKEREKLETKADKSRKSAIKVQRDDLYNTVLERYINERLLPTSGKSRSEQEKMYAQYMKFPGMISKDKVLNYMTNEERQQYDKLTDYIKKGKADRAASGRAQEKIDEVDKKISDVKDEYKESGNSKKNAENLGNLMKEQAKALDTTLNSEHLTNDEKEQLKVLKAAEAKARLDLAKEQAPYAIRNAFLIIDAIQKTFRNIGRALPQSTYSPAYTKEAYEEPELFKLWREQIEKGQERQLKAEEAVPDVIKENLTAKYTPVKGAKEAIFENQIKWADKVKDIKLTTKEKSIYNDLAMKLEKDYADYYSPDAIKDLALAETMKQAGKVDAMETYYNAFVHNNINNVQKALKSLTVGGQAKNALVAVLEAIEKSTALKASTLGIANDVLRALAAGLKEGVPSFENTEQGLKDAATWLYKISGGKPDDAISIINHCSTVSPSVLQKHSEELTKINEKASRAKSAYESAQAELDSNEEKADLKRQEMEAYEKEHPNYKNDRAYKKMVGELDNLISVDTKKRLESKRDKAKKEYDVLLIDLDNKSKVLENLMLPDALKTETETKTEDKT